MSRRIDKLKAGLKPMQPMQLLWAPRLWGPGPCVWVDCSFLQMHLALDNSVETP